MICRHFLVVGGSKWTETGSIVLESDIAGDCLFVFTDIAAGFLDYETLLWRQTAVYAQDGERSRYAGVPIIR